MEFEERTFREKVSFDLFREFLVLVHARRESIHLYIGGGWIGRGCGSMGGPCAESSP